MYNRYQKGEIRFGRKTQSLKTEHKGAFIVDILLRFADVCRLKDKDPMIAQLFCFYLLLISLFHHVVEKVYQKEIVRCDGCIDEAAPETYTNKIS